jgi:hypothetical protein
MRFSYPIIFATMLCFAPALAQAQNGQHVPLAQRFEAANVTHDGCLTQQQAAMGGLKSVARNFVQIDTARRGCVTLDQIQVFNQQRRAMKRQQTQQMQPTQQDQEPSSQ